jgi:transposase
LKPIVVEASEVRKKANRPTQKCDTRDAHEICDGIRGGIYRGLVHVPPAKVSTLRDALSRRRHFVRDATRQINAAKRLVRSAGLGHLVPASLVAECGWRSLLEDVSTEVELVEFVNAHFTVWKCVRAQAAALDEQVAQFEQDELFKEPARRLQTIPGVGPIVSMTAVAVFSDINRFPTSKHAASYAGLVPSTFNSGDRQVGGHITKRGSSELRAMFVEAAHHASRANNPLHPYFTKLCVRRGYKMAVTAVAHRLCRISFAMLKTKTDFDVTKLNVERGPFEKTRTVDYRIKKGTGQPTARVSSGRKKPPMRNGPPLPA